MYSPIGVIFIVTHSVALALFPISPLQLKTGRNGETGNEANCIPTPSIIHAQIDCDSVVDLKF